MLHSINYSSIPPLPILKNYQKECSLRLKKLPDNKDFFEFHSGNVATCRFQTCNSLTEKIDIVHSEMKSLTEKTDSTLRVVAQNFISQVIIN